MALIKCPKQYCGQVFITNNFLMMLECKFCAEEFVPYNDFLNHIFDKHIDEIEVYESDSEEDNDDEMDILENSQESEDETPVTNSLQLNDFIKTEQYIKISTSNTTCKENATVQTLTKQRNEQQATHKMTKMSSKTQSLQPQASPAAAFTNFRAVLKRVPVIPKKVKIGKYVCKFCGDTFSDRYTWQVHELRHTDNKPHPCTLCDKRFYTKTEVRLHMRRHTGERPFVCSFCGARFKTSGALGPHEAAHRNERKYKCDQCDKSYYTGAMLKKHRVVHTGERNYKCNVCSNTFGRHQSLRNHMKLHENALRYECNLCSKRFNQKPGLLWHQKRNHNILKEKGTLPELVSS